MATEALITWNAPEHLYTEKNSDWYWSVGIITLAVAAVAFIFGNVISGLFVIVAAVALVLHASSPAQIITYKINDRGIIANNVLYPFLTLESFWIPHDELPPKLIIKSRKLFMPYIIIYIDGVDPERVREVMLTYIAETMHREPLLKHVLERLGF
ncbi:MAG: hypothetical protein A3C79_02775 [Candidatus Taylorbacteria bacterium RIFCSPHIGHO2_02_FULL_45_28]|uniref:DUF5673 domain-containing protein n=1 Tax=Candidatus Taylorbacteria bacterium RIFCSPHIGHO2_12_FULL_45_16 TaxID=1802315 RepID=A0A1G2N0M7_9BACT|nr:MAG: hypothetical protein A2830_00495 [Candidatus Taylorbacteria bacterium RIFCSPHIGHO2_01_FULL_44_110]OHA24888.1 MAG: hypothetical protein A3C79_02775 [Candidatus Taylorbacteria bacterium RIFCSPHIGHO2_02_FULL_45_28]OHA29706.1 MAG: hypothetical protein A3F51_03190 [Candidatus Taylorbacteria bacterium RIFCSPHIGHO2_12_FULL_45_16]OHA32650.1 MAG: hypothetical protein A3A23_00060 [Candidatus Taylorbacteria bacterium RIFCSPLOWO2_01_FULL_45_59]OHA38803.1 MAG: hypothetical protein A3I98_01495 [Candi